LAYFAGMRSLVGEGLRAGTATFAAGGGRTSTPLVGDTPRLGGAVAFVAGRPHHPRMKL
jgi:hypothetical protein